MRTGTIVLLALCATAAAQSPARNRRVRPKAAPRASVECGTLVAYQVLLDRQGFSPAQIDGTFGANAARALTAFQQSHNLEGTGRPGCETWRALGGDTAGAPTVTYTITENDAKGPFVKKIPPDLMQQATLPALGYTSVLEKLAERFHAAPTLLQSLNRGATFSAGSEILVPDVQPFDPDAKTAPDPSASAAKVQVSREESAVRVTGPDGALIFFAPVTSGSTHDPLPPGDWKVTTVSWHPSFQYNPDLFWDAKATHSKATIKPGPNSPVGIVWIDLNLEHYGLHGTPEPANVGHTQSHGCVRLTNWDAARLAALVKPGTPVLFR